MGLEPLVSICIPVFNGEVFLQEALDSVYKQTYKNLEIVIVDDHSDDRSTEIVQQFLVKDDRIRFFRNAQRLGLVGNWNEAVSKARGEWIKFLFQDDLLNQDCVEKMVRAASDSSFEESVVFCQRYLLQENVSGISEIATNLKNSKQIWDYSPTRQHYSQNDIIRMITRLPGENFLGEPPSFMIKRDVFDKYGLFDASFHHACDIEYWLRIGVSERLLHVPESLVQFRVHDQSATTANHREKWLHVRYLERTRLFLKLLSDAHFEPARRALSSWSGRLFLRTQSEIYLRRIRVVVASGGDATWEQSFSDLLTEYAPLGLDHQRSYLGLGIRLVLSRIGLRISWAVDRVKPG